MIKTKRNKPSNSEQLPEFWRVIVMDVRYVPMQTAGQIRFLASLCAGIVHGVQPGPLIQKFTVKNRFHDSFVRWPCCSAKQLFCLVSCVLSLRPCVLTVLFHQVSKTYEKGFFSIRNGFLCRDLTFQQSGLYLSSPMAINNQFERDLRHQV